MTLLAGSWLLAAPSCWRRRVRPSPSARQRPPAFDLGRLALLDQVVGDAIAARQLPGAVVVVGRGDRVVWRKAYGARALGPAREPMTLDTIFDLASLTKVVATTPAVMMLVEDGRIRLTDPVAHVHSRSSASTARTAITVRDLLTHMSGLRPDVDLADDWARPRRRRFALAIEEVPTAPPGRRFVYSDINFFLLAEIVARVTKAPFDDVRARADLPAARHARDDVHAAGVARAAHRADGAVHAVRLAVRGPGHEDAARRRARSDGAADGRRRRTRRALQHGRRSRDLLPHAARRRRGRRRARAVAADRRAHDVAGDAGRRGERARPRLGPRLVVSRRIAASCCRSDRSATPDSPARRSGSIRRRACSIVFLSNRAASGRQGRRHAAARARRDDRRVGADRRAARRRRATRRSARQAFESQMPAVPAPPAAPVLTGIDVLRADGFKPLAGLRVGLLTNHTGRARDGAATIDLLAAAPDVKLVALFSPEHGIRGILDATVPSSTDEKTGLPIHSLYGATQRPTAEMLAGLDAIVDRSAGHRHALLHLHDDDGVRDGGGGGAEDQGRRARSAESDRRRADRRAGARCSRRVGFTGYLPAMPIRHGLTMGELAQLFNGETKIGADLTVVAMRNWRRDAWFDETGLAVDQPVAEHAQRSTRRRSIRASARSSATNLSVGRGTDTPFEHVGAPWIDGARARRRAERAPDSRRALLSRALHADGEQVRRRGVPRRLHRHHRSRRAAAGARRRRDRVGAGEAVPGQVRDRSRRAPVRIGRRSRAPEGRRRSGGRRGVVGRAEARWRLLRAKYLLY